MLGRELAKGCDLQRIMCPVQTLHLSCQYTVLPTKLCVPVITNKFPARRGFTKPNPCRFSLLKVCSWTEKTKALWGKETKLTDKYGHVSKGYIWKYHSTYREAYTQRSQHLITTMPNVLAFNVGNCLEKMKYLHFWISCTVLCILSAVSREGTTCHTSEGSAKSKWSMSLSFVATIHDTASFKPSIILLQTWVLAQTTYCSKLPTSLWLLFSFNNLIWSLSINCIYSHIIHL